jgi:hypothetical protein
VTGRPPALPGPPRPNGKNVSNCQQRNKTLSISITNVSNCQQCFSILLKAITNVSNCQQWFELLIKRVTHGFRQNVSNVSNVSNGKKSGWK